MKVIVIYCHPCLNSETYDPLAQRFVRSYMEHPGGTTDHELWVGLNGVSKSDWRHERLFQPLRPEYLPHNNFGKDIGLFQQAAYSLDCDLLVCFGSHIYFHRAGWLDRIVQAYLENGPCLYGAWGVHHPLPHLRTTGFWLPRDLLKLYPYQIGNGERYSFEHGSESITLWSQKMGFEPKLVTWNGVYEMKDWRSHNRQDVMFYDQWYDRYGG